MFIKVDNKFVNVNHIVLYYQGDNTVHIVLTSGAVRLDNKTVEEFEDMIRDVQFGNIQLDFESELVTIQ